MTLALAVPIDALLTVFVDNMSAFNNSVLGTEVYSPQPISIGVQTAPNSPLPSSYPVGIHSTRLTLSRTRIPRSARNTLYSCG